MLFNSIGFLFFYLPVTILAFFLIHRAFGVAQATVSLVIASLCFYGFWNPKFLLLLVASITFNYLLAVRLIKTPAGTSNNILFCLGVLLNLTPLFFFKYFDFVITNVNALMSTSITLLDLTLPLAISFFTFQQIAFLNDVRRGALQAIPLIRYSLFVVFFPQLIAGPIVKYSDVENQFKNSRFGQFLSEDCASGVALFALGLAKKILIADQLATFADPVFANTSSGITPEFFEAWIATLAFTFQIYFDFSGYCDMAMGLALIFGIRLPVNFNSPYQAVSIIEFWRRWHMTLSRFLRDHVYIPLGGNRFGITYQIRNIFIVMLVAGIWHGAGWTFIAWGCLHGILIIANHIARRLSPLPSHYYKVNFLQRPFSWAFTFLTVTFSWVFFRANSISDALSICGSMLGLNGISVSPRIANKLPMEISTGGFLHIAVERAWLGVVTLEALPLIVIALSLCLMPSNNAQLFNFLVDNRVRLFPMNIPTGFIIGLLFCICVVFITARATSNFLYFQF